MDETNVISIYLKAHETIPVLNQVVELCYEFLSKKFSEVVALNKFYEIPEDLLRKLVRNVVPKWKYLIDKQRNSDEDDNNDDEDDDDDDEED
jgi:hypothetical protein